MDTETEEKLTGQQYQIDRLSDKVEAKMETMVAKNKATHAESESAIDRFRLSNVEAIEELRTENVKAIGRLRLDYEKAIGELRSTIERSARNLLVQMILVVGAGVAILAVILK